jgi:hypothetical protein
VIVLGLIFLPFNRFSVSDLRQQAWSDTKLHSKG